MKQEFRKELIDKIEAIKGIKKVESFEGDPPDLVSKLVSKLPAAYIMYDGKTKDSENSDDLSFQDHSFVVFIVYASVKKNNTSIPGNDELTESIEDALRGLKTNVVGGIGSWQWVQEKTVYQDKSLIITAQNYVVTGVKDNGQHS